jgi:hypothetical protein
MIPENHLIFGTEPPKEIKIVQAYKDRTVADGGTFESQKCIKTRARVLSILRLYDSASLVITANGYKVNKVYALKPVNGDGDMPFTRSTSGLRANESGLFETVGINIPRMNHLGGCPNVLYETQNTNQWTNNNVTEGYGSGDSMVKGATVPNAFGAGINGFEYESFPRTDFLSFTYNIRGVNTLNLPVQRCCIYIKNPSSDFFSIFVSGGVAVNFQFSTLLSSNDNGTIEKVNGNTYALYVHINTASGNEFAQVRVGFVPSLVNNSPISGTCILGLGQFFASISSGGNGFLPFVYSPIITTAAAVTRTREQSIKIGAQDLIGQTTGTLLIKGFQLARGWILRISDGTSTNQMGMFCVFSDGRNQFIFVSSGSRSFIDTGNTPLKQINKNAVIKYSPTSVQIWVNGVQYVNNVYATPTPFSNPLNRIEIGSITEFGTARYDTIALWKTGLSDYHCQKLSKI